jgi:hypothetical protein
MLPRVVLLALGLLELLAPRPLVDFWFRLATTGDSEAQLRPWVYTAARLEGVAIILWALTQGRRD